MSEACSSCTGVQSLAEKPRDGLNVIQRKKNLGLLAAACLGHSDCLDIFIDKGADVNCTDSDFDKDCRKSIRIDTCGSFDGYTPLMYAVAFARLKDIKSLVAAGADVNVVRNKRTALGVAARRGYPSFVKYLIGAGANVNVADPAVQPALMYAVRMHKNSQEKCVDILIKAGADVNARYCPSPQGTAEPTTILLEIAKHGTHVIHRVLSAVLEAGADVNVGNKVEFPLHAAIDHERDFEFIELLVDAGADVNLKDGSGATPLHTTVKLLEQKDTIRLLLETGADVNALDKRGGTPLMTAAHHSSVFLEGLYSTDYDEQTHRYRVRFMEPIRLLLEAGARINRRNYNGNNALGIVCSHSNPEGENFQLDLCMLLYAVGDTLDGPNVPGGPGSSVSITEIPECFKELRKKMDLKHLCREAIRKHLIDVDPHEHLFKRIPKLELPSFVTEYILYDCTLDSEKALKEGIVDRDPGFRYGPAWA